MNESKNVKSQNIEDNAYCLRKKRKVGMKKKKMET